MEEKTQEKQETIVPRVIEDEMKTSYLDYSMSVIVGRALPDIRDGLKPVHRRILYAMHQMGMLHNKPFKKCARIVGEVLGKYHPHGDVAVYDALVRMTQDFSLRYPLIQGQGNFGSIDGDSPAAMRYTEARLNKLSEEMLQDIEKETVKFVDNFDGSLEEPSVLPCKVPNLLINGSSGIAVGMATNIPPHNMNEVVDGVIAQINNPEISFNELLIHVKGPDFPTGGIICGRKGIIDTYSTGRGKIIVRAKTHLEDTEKLKISGTTGSGKPKKRIIIDEVPYAVNKAEMIIQIANLVKHKKIKDIRDIRDESDKEGIRVVLSLSQEANPDVVLNQLFKHTRMQITFGVIMLALVDGAPRVLDLRSLVQNYIDYRKKIVRKRTEFDLSKSEKRAHVLEGLIIALKDIDKTVKVIRASKSVEEAIKNLIEHLKITKEQSIAILDMKLQKLTSLEQDKTKKEREELLKLIEELKAILGSEQRILDIIKKELEDLKKEYGDKRRTLIEETEQELETEDLIQQESVVVTISHSGYIKRQPLNTYKQQKRGGKGIIAAGTKEEDFIEDLFTAETHDYVLFFTNKGKVHWLKVYEIPEGSRQAKGNAIVNMLNLKDEKVTACVPVKNFKEGHVFMSTKKGIVKKTPLENFSSPRKGGIVAVSLNGDELINVVLTDGNQNIIIATKDGMAVKFSEKDVRAMGRNSYGVRGIKLKDKDEVVDMVIAKEENSLLTITENGYGKRTRISEYRLINRGGSGVINIQCTDRNGKVIAVKSTNDDELMFISKKGILIRTSAFEISEISRNTQGVTIMKLDEGDKVVAAAKIVRE